VDEMTITSAATDTPAREVSPEPILQLATGFIAAKHLLAASERGLEFHNLWREGNHEGTVCHYARSWRG
jgi:hypothetical protein